MNYNDLLKKLQGFEKNYQNDIVPVEKRLKELNGERLQVFNLLKLVKKYKKELKSNTDGIIAFTNADYDTSLNFLYLRRYNLKVLEKTSLQLDDFSDKVDVEYLDNVSKEFEKLAMDIDRKLRLVFCKLKTTKNFTETKEFDD